MTDLEHTPLSHVSGKPRQFTPGYPNGVHYEAMPTCHICEDCGCFFLPQSNAVCGNKLLRMLKETVL